MNNHAELVTDNGTIGLTFGMIACEEFMRLQLGKELNEVGSLNGHQAIAEIMYAGAYNHCVVNRKPTPKLADIADIVDDLYDKDDQVAQLNEACQIFNESRFGKEIPKIVEAKKKEVENLLQQTGVKLDDAPTENLD